MVVLMALKLKHKKGGIKQFFGWLGAIILLLIIPIKIFRFAEMNYTTKLIIDIAPSILGPAGLLFLVLSSSSKWLNRSLLQSTFLVAFTALALEFMQLLPRPGFLKHLHYTFDWSDVISSIISLTIAYVVAKIVIYYFQNKYYS
jgi:hypothetical protein